MILKGNKGDETTGGNVHTEKKIKRKKNVGGTVSFFFTEHEDKLYKISFIKRRRVGKNTSVPYGYK